MRVKIVIAGSRKYNNYEEAKEFIKKCLTEIENPKELIFLSGGCTGSDKIGEKFALENGYKTEQYPANWARYGRGAGPKRNQTMAEKCDFVICFWDGKSKGTKSMIELAKKFNKPVKIKWI